jgi:hypothetical protein
MQDDVSDEAPVIASVRSKDEWFALTPFRFVQRQFDVKRTVPLDLVEGVVGDARGFTKAKIQGGTLVVRLSDKSTFEMQLESGGPYFALMNVFLSLARVNRKSSGNLIRRRPTTDDQRRFL